jgi:acetyltransferase-like isoleucine patch superfamily enzyme
MTVDRVVLALWRRSVRRASRELEDRRNRELVGRCAEVGHGVRLKGKIDLTGARKVRIGNNVHIGTGAFIRAEGGLVIGDNTHISRNLLLYTMNHDYLGTVLPYDEALLYKPVTIGRNVWIGMNVCIAPGATIGDGAIVGMGTVVAGEVPSLAIVASAPWRIVGHRDESHYQALEQEGLFGGRGGRPLT